MLCALRQGPAALGFLAAGRDARARGGGGPGRLPGSSRVARAQGNAQISADAALREEFAVHDKVPKLVTRVAAPSIEWRDSAALARARPWDAPAPPADIDPAEIFAAHVRLNKTRGLAAALARGAVSIPGLMRKGLEQDYKRNMY